MTQAAQQLPETMPTEEKSIDDRKEKLLNVLSQLLSAADDKPKDEKQIEVLITEEVKKQLKTLPPMKIKIKDKVKTVEIEGYIRPEFKSILDAATCGLNIMLIGPTGCGKTHIAAQVAKALDREFASVSCTAGMSESSLTGWLLPDHGGVFTYTPSDFVRLYENGGVFLFDEMDAADNNTLLFINQAIGNGFFHLPQRKGATLVTRHENFVCMAACNTYGNGSDMFYAGREKLDEATLDRFRAGTLQMGYDGHLEEMAVDPELLLWAMPIRDKIAKARLTRVMSTRFLIEATRLMKHGVSLKKIKETYFIGWNKEEMDKVK